MKKYELEDAINSAIKKEKNHETTFGCLACGCILVLFPILCVATDFITSSVVTVIIVILLKLVFGR
jgi:hypothetical protein